MTATWPPRVTAEKQGEAVHQDRFKRAVAVLGDLANPSVDFFRQFEGYRLEAHAVLDLRTVFRQLYFTLRN